MGEARRASQIGHSSALATHLGVVPCKKNGHLLSGPETHSIFRTHAARISPELFSALVLVDPVIFPAPTEPGMRWADGWGATVTLIALGDGAVTRRNGWKSKYVLCCPVEVILIRSFVIGRTLYNCSRRIPSLLTGIHFH